MGLISGNSKKPILGVDVDLVLVRSDVHWNCWLMSQANTFQSRLPESDIDYNLAKYYPEVKNPLDFWRCERLYDTMAPNGSSSWHLTDLANYFDIVYISAIKGNHHKSKYNFVSKNFPKGVGFIATKEKHLVNVDIMIDDRSANLDLFAPDVYKILYKTKYKQDTHPNPIACKNWKEVHEKCMSYLEVKECLNERREKARREII